MTNPQPSGSPGWLDHLVAHWVEVAAEIGDHLEKRLFLLRMLRIFVLLTVLGTISVGVGALGFRLTEDFDWLRSFYWATMVITSCGLPSEPSTESGKIWAILYAFYGAAYFAGVFVVFVTPIGHRLIQRYIYLAHRKAAEKLQQAGKISAESLGKEAEKKATHASQRDGQKERK